MLSEIADTGQESFPRFQQAFVDKLWVDYRSGDGGNPEPGVNRSYHVHKGPAYGGHGADIYLRSTTDCENLLEVPRKMRGRDGGDGHGTRRGNCRDPIYIRVPIGTIIRERKAFRTPEGEIFRTPDEGRRVYLPEFKYQFLYDNQKLLICRGGIGGLGPRSFRFHDGRKGTVGERKRLELEYRVVTDVALIGRIVGGYVLVVEKKLVGDFQQLC